MAQSYATKTVVAVIVVFAIAILGTSSAHATGGLSLSSLSSSSDSTQYLSGNLGQEGLDAVLGTYDSDSSTGAGTVLNVSSLEDASAVIGTNNRDQNGMQGAGLGAVVNGLEDATVHADVTNAIGDDAQSVHVGLTSSDYLHSTSGAVIIGGTSAGASTTSGLYLDL